MRVDLSGLGEITRTMQRLGDIDRPALLDAIGFTVENQTKNRILLEKHAPDGAAWAPLSPRYAKAKAERKGSVGMLEFDGHLYRSLQHDVQGDSVHVGSNLAYAAIHQFGGEIKREARTAQLYFKQGRDGSVGNRFVSQRQANFVQDVSIGAHSTQVPARPYLGFSSQNEDEINDVAVRFLRRHVEALT